MPVVVDDVVAIGYARRRPLPQVPVQPLGHGHGLALADRIAMRHVPCLAPRGLADQLALPDQLRRDAERHGRAPLAALLEHHARLSPRIEDHLALVRTERARLLHVDCLARAHRHHCAPRVEVVGRLGHHGAPGVEVVGRLGEDAVDGLVLEDLAQVLLLLRTARAVALLLHEVGRVVHRARIHVAHVGDLHARHLERALHDGRAASLFTAAHEREPHAIRRRIRAKRPTGGRNEERARPAEDKFFSVHGAHCSAIPRRRQARLAHYQRFQVG